MTEIAFCVSLAASLVYYHQRHKHTIPHRAMGRFYAAEYCLMSIAVVGVVTYTTYAIPHGDTFERSIAFIAWTLLGLDLSVRIIGKKESEKEKFMAELSGEIYGKETDGA